MKRAVFIVVALCSVHLAVGQTAIERFSALMDEFQTWRMKENPELSTQRADCRFNDRLSTYSMSRFTDYKNVVDGYYARLASVNMNELPKNLQISYKLLKSHFDTYKAGYQWRFYKNLNPINFLEGFPKDIAKIASNAPMYTKGDMENFLTRLELVPTQLSEVRSNLEEAVRQGTTNHAVTMNRVHSQFAKFTGVKDMKDSSLYTPVKDNVENGNKFGYSNSERQNIQTRAITAINNIVSSLTGLHNYINNSYTTRPQYGVSSFTNGKAYYEAIMNWYLSLETTVKDVHDTGKKEVERISKKMYAIMRKQGHTGTIKEYFADLMKREDMVYHTAEDLMAGYTRQIKEIIQPKMSKFFSVNPDLPIVVKSLGYDGPQGMYDRGTPDGSKPGVFWANTERPKDILKPGMMALTLHETNPGHHLQIGIAMTSRLPAFRGNLIYDYHFEAPVAFQAFRAYSEGWALYAERLGEEMGVYQDDYELMGRYSSEIFRACRLVVDTGLHYYNWDRETAINYILNYTAFTRATTETEIDRYITWPGQALTYKIGELKIVELREKAEEYLGKNFDIKEFHRVMLAHGRMPLSLIEELFNEWLTNYKPPDKPVVSYPSSTGAILQISLLLFLPLLAML